MAMALPEDIIEKLVQEVPSVQRVSHHLHDLHQRLSKERAVDDLTTGRRLVPYSSGLDTYACDRLAVRAWWLDGALRVIVGELSAAEFYQSIRQLHEVGHRFRFYDFVWAVIASSHILKFVDVVDDVVKVLSLVHNDVDNDIGPISDDVNAVVKPVPIDEAYDGHVVPLPDKVHQWLSQRNLQPLYAWRHEETWFQAVRRLVSKDNLVVRPMKLEPNDLVDSPVELEPDDLVDSPVELEPNDLAGSPVWPSEAIIALDTIDEYRTRLSELRLRDDINDVDVDDVNVNWGQLVVAGLWPLVAQWLNSGRYQNDYSQPQSVDRERVNRLFRSVAEHERSVLDLTLNLSLYYLAPFVSYADLAVQHEVFNWLPVMLPPTRQRLLQFLDPHHWDVVPTVLDGRQLSLEQLEQYLAIHRWTKSMLPLKLASESALELLRQWWTEDDLAQLHDVFWTNIVITNDNVVLLEKFWVLVGKPPISGRVQHMSVRCYHWLLTMELTTVDDELIESVGELFYSWPDRRNELNWDVLLLWRTICQRVDDRQRQSIINKLTKAVREFDGYQNVAATSALVMTALEML